MPVYPGAHPHSLFSATGFLNGRNNFTIFFLDFVLFCPAIGIYSPRGSRLGKDPAGPARSQICLMGARGGVSPLMRAAHQGAYAPCSPGLRQSRSELFVFISWRNL